MIKTKQNKRLQKSIWGEESLPPSSTPVSHFSQRPHCTTQLLDYPESPINYYYLI